MRNKEDIDKQLKYVATPQPAMAHKQSKKASNKIVKISDEEEEE